MSKNQKKYNSTAIVIGGGIVGLATAIHLQRSGVQVRLVERNHVGAGASFGNATMLTNSSIVPVAIPGLIKKLPYYLTHPDSPLRVKWGFVLKNFGWFFKFWLGANPRDMWQRSHALNLILCDVCEQHRALAKGTPAEKYITTRATIYPYIDEDAVQADADIWRIRTELCSGISRLDGNDLHKAMPAIGKHWQKSYLMSDYGSIASPIKYLQGLADGFEKLGGEIIHSPVLDFTTRDKQVTGVVTNHGILTADQYAICAGAYSATLTQKLGDDIPLMAESGYHIQIKNPNIELKHNILDGNSSMGVAMVDGDIRCTLFAEYAGLDATPDYDNALRVVKKNLANLLPDLQIKDYTLWRGDRPSTPDSLPVISRACHYDNVFYGFGHQHVGLSGGAKTGKVLSEIMNQQATSIDITPFSAERF